MNKITYEQYIKLMNDIKKQFEDITYTPSFDYLDFSVKNIGDIINGLRNELTRDFVIANFVENEKMYRIYPKVTKEVTCLQYIGLIKGNFYFYDDDAFERDGGLYSLVQTEFSSSDIISFGGDDWLNENGLYKREY